MRLGRTSDAHWELEKLCAADPHRADAHAANALVLVRLGRPVAAEEQAELALAIDPDLPAAHRARAEILRRAGELEEATREIELAIAANPGSVEDRLLRATILAARGLWDEAARALGDLVAAAPRQPEVRFVMAFVALDRASPRRRCATPTTRSRSAPHYPEARLLRAEALLQLVRARRGSSRARAVPRRGAAHDGGRARAGRAGPDQRSAIESPPMPLRLRMLPAPSSGVGSGQSPGPTEERAIELADETNEVRIGRRPDLELPLPYPALSALHARLMRADGRWQIEDLGSTNGTRVDGERLMPRSRAASRPARRSSSVRSPSSSTAPSEPWLAPNGPRPSRAGW